MRRRRLPLAELGQVSVLLPSTSGEGGGDVNSLAVGPFGRRFRHSLDGKAPEYMRECAHNIFD